MINLPLQSQKSTRILSLLTLSLFQYLSSKYRRSLLILLGWKKQFTLGEKLKWRKPCNHTKMRLLTSPLRRPKQWKCNHIVVIIFHSSSQFIYNDSNVLWRISMNNTRGHCCLRLQAYIYIYIYIYIQFSAVAPSTARRRSFWTKIHMRLTSTLDDGIDGDSNRSSLEAQHDWRPSFSHCRGESMEHLASRRHICAVIAVL